MTERRQVTQLPLKRKMWLSLRDLHSWKIEQMWLGRNGDVKIGLGGKRAIYCFCKMMNDEFNFKEQLKCRKKKSYIQFQKPGINFY